MSNDSNSGFRVVGFVRRFSAAENGVVAAEWVALAGAVLIGAIAVGWLVLNALQAPAGSVGTTISSCEQLAAANSGATTSCN